MFKSSFVSWNGDFKMIITAGKKVYQILKKRLQPKDHTIVEFFTYFNKKQDGEKMKKVIIKEGYYSVSYSLLEHNGISQWSLRFSKVLSSEELEIIEEKLFSYAKKYNGEYDGFERMT